MSYPIYVPQIGNELAEAINEEIARARKKFPENRHKLAALVEEVGELAQALLDHERGDGSINDIRKEAIQVAAMAIRIYSEGDSDFPKYAARALEAGR